MLKDGKQVPTSAWHWVPESRDRMPEGLDYEKKANYEGTGKMFPCKRQYHDPGYGPPPGYSNLTLSSTASMAAKLNPLFPFSLWHEHRLAPRRGVALGVAKAGSLRKCHPGRRPRPRSGDLSSRSCNLGFMILEFRVWRWFEALSFHILARTDWDFVQSNF